MTIHCDGDLRYLKIGKTVMLKSYQGLRTAPPEIHPAENYWLLLGKKGIVASNEIKKSESGYVALINFEKNIHELGLKSPNNIENALWISIDDLKFVCRY